MDTYKKKKKERERESDVEQELARQRREVGKEITA